MDADGYLRLFDGEAQVLTDKLRRKIKLREKDHDHLIHLNDSGTSFRKIADYIEENL